MSIQSFRIIRLFLWGILIVVLLTIGTMYVLRQAIQKKRAEPVVMTEPPPLAPMGEAPQFKLTAQDGKEFDSSSLRGSVYVVDFFFTKCRGICPTLQKNMKVVNDAFSDNPSVKLLSISVDPKNDTVSTLAAEAKKFGADTQKWAWAVGPAKATSEIANGYKLMGTVVPGDILHSNRLVLVDGYGRIRGYYVGTEDADVAQIQEDIRRLLGE
jgi:protein SCO1/2